jgi:NADH-quinone oxidoreductase subunit F
MCGLGQSAPNPVLSTLRYFRHEYEQHIIEKRCSAFVCKDLVGAPCQTACPLGTQAWRYVAHIGRGEYEQAYTVIREANPFPSVCARVCHHPCESRCRAGQAGGDAIAIRALKRFITDRIDPSTYQPARSAWPAGEAPRVAVIGSGPAGLTAAHYLSLKGCRVTVFEAENRAGGMLTCAIPSYRLPRETIEKEIASLLNENVEIRCNAALGSDISVDSLFKDGYQAVLLAMGAHKSKPLKVENEDVEGVYPSIEFLKAFNLGDKSKARGRVGVIGGGNSAFDAARMALRQKDVEKVLILYRRTRDEMPAFPEEIEAADQEGIEIHTLVTPTRILSDKGHIAALECVRNELGEPDASGRRRPVPIPDSQFIVPLDTLVVAIGEDSGIDCIGPALQSGIETTSGNTVKVDFKTMLTNRPGVFAAGDVVTGPNTVVEAIAAGKKSAVMIARYLLKEDLTLPFVAENIPKVYLEPVGVEEGQEPEVKRVETPRASVEWRKRNFAEVEVALSVTEARRESHRCLRCDLEFTKPKPVEPIRTEVVVGGKA